MGEELWAIGLIVTGPMILRKLLVWYYSPQPSLWKARLSPVSPLSPPSDQHRRVNPSQYATVVIVAAAVIAHVRSIWRATDLFLAIDLPVTAPTVELRSRLASMSYAEMGWSDSLGEANLEKLLQRLASMDGRRSYLIHGPGPLLECAFCKTSDSLAYFALARRAVWYLMQAFLIGLLTVPGSALAVFDRAIATALERPEATPAQQQEQTHELIRWHRAHWRKPALWALASLALVRTGAQLSYSTVSTDQGRLNHWNVNLQLFEAVALIALLLALQLYPSLGPQPVAAHQIIASQHVTMRALDNSLIGHQTMSIHRDLLKTHPSLQSKVTQGWAEARRAQGSSDPEASAQAQLQGLKCAAERAKVDVRQETATALNYARKMWDGTLIDDSAADKV